MKPVYETSSRTENYTVMRPVTTCQTQYVDQGHRVAANGYEAELARHAAALVGRRHARSIRPRA